MTENNPQVDLDTRVETLAHDTDLGWVAAALAARRDQILDNWHQAVSKQPFHVGRQDYLVADDIPRLFDALVDLLQRDAPRWVTSTAPLDDPAVLAAAEGHARARSDQGLRPADVLAEFRLLRQEIWRALRSHLGDDVPIRDVLGAEVLVNDALDGVTGVGLRTLTEQTERVREDFLATTVHEVRQPITIIRGAAQLAARQLRRAEPDLGLVAEQLRQIQSTSDRMADLLMTLVETSRAALGRLELQPASTDLVAVVRECVAQLGPVLGKRVQLQAPQTDATGEWDPQRLSQVVGNLLSNALKYSPADAAVEVRVESNLDAVRLAVSDSGVGIDPEDLPKLFHRFARARSAVDAGIGGIGLGLYLSRAVVEGHGGRIWAESGGRGRGTTVQVVLPRRPANVSAA